MDFLKKLIVQVSVLFIEATILPVGVVIIALYNVSLHPGGVFVVMLLLFGGISFFNSRALEITSKTVSAGILVGLLVVFVSSGSIIRSTLLLFNYRSYHHWLTGDSLSMTIATVLVFGLIALPLGVVLGTSVGKYFDQRGRAQVRK